MCTSTVDGVLIVREGAQRLRWAHEMEGGWPPLHARDWQIAALWPDDDARQDIRVRLDRGEPVVVILDAESARVELPVEHVARVPEGVTLVEEDAEGGMLTLEVPFLDWLNPVERACGIAFLNDARATIDRTPRYLLPPLIVKPPDATSKPRLVFAQPTRSGCATSLMLSELVRHVSTGTAQPQSQQRPGENYKRTAVA